MKWRYDRRFKQWWIDGEDYFIEKTDIGYKLVYSYFKTIGIFKKLKSAKKVAELIIEG